MAFSTRGKSAAARYGVAIAAVVVAFAARYGIYGTLENRIPFGFFTLATLIAAWYGGLGPGLLAAVAGLILADRFFLPPHSAGGGIGETERTAIGIYAITNVLVVVLFWHIHGRLREAEDRLKKFERDERPGEAGRAQERPGAPGSVQAR